MEKKETVWSHSRLNTILEDPMRYYLQYKQGMSPKTEKNALAVGSMTHWGIEHNTEDLSGYIEESGSFKQKLNYTKDQLLAEAMVHGYLKHKEDLFDKLLDDGNGNRLELLDEIHEVNLTSELPSHKYKDFSHKFMGIIDLLLMTEKGFVLIDYKTSSQIPDVSKYLEQIYRYIMLLKSNFPDVPIYKMGIINIRKTQIRQKQNENEESFLNRMKLEYEINDEDYVNLFVYTERDINERLVNDYIYNLSDTLDFAKMIEDNEMWFINYNNARTVYGKSDFYDIYYDTQDCYVLYKIKDNTIDDFTGEILDSRDCLPIDLLTVKNKNVLNHYRTFEEELTSIFESKPDLIENKNEIFKNLNDRFITDNNLLESYWSVFQHKLLEN